MKTGRLTLSAIAVILMASCNQQPASAPAANADSAMAAFPKKDTVPAVQPITADMLDFPKDPVCGMPVHAEIADTTKYKGKIYGFCAPECKADFLKNPESFLTSK